MSASKKLYEALKGGNEASKLSSEDFKKLFMKSDAFQDALSSLNEESGLAKEYTRETLKSTKESRQFRKIIFWFIAVTMVIGCLIFYGYVGYMLWSWHCCNTPINPYAIIACLFPIIGVKFFMD